MPPTPPIPEAPPTPPGVAIAEGRPEGLVIPTPAGPAPILPAEVPMPVDEEPGQQQFDRKDV